MGRGRSSSGGRGMSSSSSGRGMSRSSSIRSSSRGYRGTTIIYRNSSGSSYGSGMGGSSRSGVIAAAVVLLIFAAFFLIGGFSALISSRNDDRYIAVSATAVDNTLSGGWYYTTYEYEVDGIDYRQKSVEGWEFEEQIGKVVTIYYLEGNPCYITEEKPENDASGGIIVLMIIGAGFGALGVGMVIKAVRMKNEPAAIPTTNEVTTPSVSIPTNTCAYCGTTYSKEQHSCPKCGASRTIEK